MASDDQGECAGPGGLPLAHVLLLPALATHTD